MIFSVQARLLVVLALAMASTGCEMVGNIFQAGMWVGVILVVLVVVAIMFIVGKMRR